jgi:hypothetical protein
MGGLPKRAQRLASDLSRYFISYSPLLSLLENELLGFI